MPQKAQAILLDAHNIIHRLPGLREQLRHDAEAARWAFERLFAGKRRLHVFYDGGPNGDRSRTVRHGLQITYSGDREADADIVNWLNQRGGPGALVVTADRELINRCKARGAKIMHPDDFLSLYLPSETADTEPDRGPPPAHEVSEWLDIFGDEEFN